MPRIDRLMVPAVGLKLARADNPGQMRIRLDPHAMTHPPAWIGRLAGMLSRLLARQIGDVLDQPPAADHVHELMPQADRQHRIPVVTLWP